MDDPSDPAPAPGGKGRWAGVFWVTFALVAAQGICWALATPLLAGPDEPSHVIAAAADGRGDLVKAPDPPQPAAVQRVRVPRFYAELPRESLCLELEHAPAACVVPALGCRQLTQQTATCGYPLTGGTEPTEVTTYTGRYPPLYDLVVGLPTLAWASSFGLYAMRLLSVLLSAVLLALAFVVVRRWTRRGLVVAGLALALTPTALYLTAVVNPNGLEVSAALCLWAAGVALVVEPRDQSPPALVAVAGASLVVLVLSRPDSPLWAAGVVAVLVLVADRRSLRALVRSRPARWWAAGVVVATGLAVAWIVAEHATDVLPTTTIPPGTTRWLAIARTAVGALPSLLHELVGVLGWDNAALPFVAYLLWLGGAGAVLTVAATEVRRRQWRLALGTALCVLAAAVVPVVYSVATVRSVGYVVQGRYLLPATAGALVLGTLVIARAPGAHRRLGRMLVVLAVVVQLLTFVTVLRRYTVGLDGPLNPFVRVPGGWAPPGTGPVLMVAFAALCVGWTWWLWQLADATAVHPGEPAQPPAADEARTAAG